MKQSAETFQTDIPPSLSAPHDMSFEGGGVDIIPGEAFFELSEDAEASKISMRFLAFNTAVDLTLYSNDRHDVVGRDRESAQAVLYEAKDLCREYERLFSRTLPHSDINRINCAQGQAISVDPRTFELLGAAKRYCALSDGAFDITIEPVIRLWNFREGIAPCQEDVQRALVHVDWRNLELIDRDEGVCFVQLRDPEASLDVGGIAKGWIADRLTELFAKAGFGDCIVNLGGNVAVAGDKPHANYWSVGIRDPEDRDAIVAKVELQEGSVVTSGIYERCFERAGMLYHHILDPATGFPVQTDVLSATAVCATSLDAEGFSTTLVALGLERGCVFVAGHPEIVQALFITKDREVISFRP